MKVDVLVTGCFNTLHAGHVKLLEFASGLGEVTVGLNADWYLQKKYGKYAIPLVNRAYCLRSNRFVHNVIVFKEEHPGNLIYKTTPNIFVRGPDYSDKELPEQQALDDVGCRLVIHRANKIGNSSDIVGGLGASAFAPIGQLDPLLFPESIVQFKQSKEPLAKPLPLIPGQDNVTVVAGEF